MSGWQRYGGFHRSRGDAIDGGWCGEFGRGKRRLFRSGNGDLTRREKLDFGGNFFVGHACESNGRSFR